MAARILVVDDSPTLRRVVSSILERNGYEPHVATDGREAMDALVAGEVKADLVLLDFVMPRMNGYQFCRALREDQGLAALPVVLMSAKADRIRDQFVEQTGAIDTITKPFDARALVAVVENALRRASTQARISSVRLPDLEPDDYETREVAAPETRRTRVTQVIAQKLAQAVTRALEEVPGAGLADALPEILEQEAVVELIDAVKSLDARETAPALSGDMAALPIGAILQLLQTESQSGVLVCRGPDSQVTITFRSGLVDLVRSSGASDEFRLGRFFVDEGIVAPAEIDALLQPADEEPAPPSRVHARGQEAGSPGPVGAPGAPRARLLGARLLAARKITEAQLEAALTRQSSELLYEVMRWSSGRFELRREPWGGPEPAPKLGLPVAALVMEGFRRVDEWRVLEKRLGSFDAVLLRDEGALGKLDAQALPDREKRVFDLVDGERTVRRVVEDSHMSSFDACRVLVQLLEARLIRARA